MEVNENQPSMESAGDVRGIPTVLRAVYDLTSKFWMDEQGCVLTISETTVIKSGGARELERSEHYEDCKVVTCPASSANPNNRGHSNRSSASVVVNRYTLTNDRG